MKSLNQVGKVKVGIALFLWMVVAVGVLGISFAEVQVINPSSGLGPSANYLINQTPVFVSVWSPVATATFTPMGTLTPSNTPTKTFTPNLTATITFTPTFTNTPIFTGTPSNVQLFDSNGNPVTFTSGNVPVTVSNPLPTPYAGYSSKNSLLAQGAVPTAHPANTPVSPMSDLSERQIFLPYAPLASWLTASASVSTAITVQLVAKSGSLNNIVMGFSLTSTSATLASDSFTGYLVSNGVTISACTVQSPATGTSAFTPNCSVNYPIYVGNNPVSFTLSAAVTSVIACISYIQSQ